MRLINGTNNVGGKNVHAIERCLAVVLLYQASGSARMACSGRSARSSASSCGVAAPALTTRRDGAGAGAPLEALFALSSPSLPAARTQMGGPPSVFRWSRCR